MILRGHGVTLVPLDRRHLEATRSWANDWEIAELMDRAMPVSDEAHERWYAGIQSRMDCVYFAIEQNSAENAHVDNSPIHLGNVWLWSIDPRHRKAEIRVVVGAMGNRSRGAGSEAIALITRYATERLNLERLYAYCLASNARAVKAFVKAGFEQEGVFRRDRWSGSEYVDVVALGYLRPASTSAIPPAQTRQRLTRPEGSLHV